jgi:FKBP-type peptidyl-prolyl cis-trans isomerase 2
MEKLLAKTGDKVEVHYNGMLEDGTVFDSSLQRGMTLNLVIGAGQTIVGFDSAIVGMELEETKKVTIPYTQAYGPKLNELVQVVPKTFFPEDFNFVPGAAVTGVSQEGQEIFAKLLAEQEEGYKLDFNHPLAGMDLTFEITLMKIEN